MVTRQIEDSPADVVIGDSVDFYRKGYLIQGRVIEVRPATVMVEIDEPSAKLLDYENEFTVVNHKHYSVVKPV